MAFTATALAEQIGAVLTTTMKATAKNKVADNVTNGLLMFHWLNKAGQKKQLSGGQSISIPVMLALNTTAKSYRGYDIGDIASAEGITCATYPWRQLRVFVRISGLENFQNSSDHAIANLMSIKLDQAVLSLRNEINRQSYLLGSGNSYKDIMGLAQIVHIAPSTNTIGMISTSNTAWRNIALDDDTDVPITGADTWAKVRHNMRYTYNKCSRGQDHPTLLLGRQEVYEYYEGSLSTQERYENKDVVSGEFEGLMFKGAPFFYDADMPLLSDVYSSGVTAGQYHVYFLNHKHLWWVTAKGADFSPGQFQKPIGQDAYVADIKTYGNLCCDLRGSQGVYFDITTAIAS